MDTISLGVTLAFAFECYEKGLLTQDRAGRASPLAIIIQCSS
jgi:aldehyde:ferredoxin oxidoreductase